MNTPKGLNNIAPKQVMHSSTLDTPLRRRSVLNLSLQAAAANSPLILPAENLIRHINDDEEERRNSRRFDAGSGGVVDSGLNLAEAQDSLNSCLKLFAENKISKDNAWNLNIIDSLSKLLKKHHHSLSNFQVAGSTLEASTKVYTLRVDSVYTDVLRMSSDLSRQTAKTLTKKGRGGNNDDEGDNDLELENGDNDKENLDANQTEATSRAKPKVKKRRHVATVTKNPDTLNARLETHPLVDPFFAKLNSMVGDINSSKRLMQNIIPTKESNLKLQQNVLVWDSNDPIATDLKEEFNFETLGQDDFATVTSVSNNNTEDWVLRTGLKNYRICDQPLESVDEANNSIRQNEGTAEDINETLIGRNLSNVGLAFDINAEVEPIPNEQSFVMDFGDMNENDFDDIDEDQRNALNRCRGLKRQPILIEDMQPETSAALSDYSYRPLDTINQWWAGPSHWKFRYSRRTENKMSVGSRTSLQGSTSCVSEIQAAAQQRPKTVRKKKIVRRAAEVTVEEALNAEDFDSLFVDKKKSKSTQLTVQIMTKRWDSKKLKLPVDHHISSEMFDTFSHAAAITIDTNPDATFTEMDNGNTYNYDNELDRNYCSQADMHSDTETNTDMGQMDNNLEFEMADMLPPPPLPPQQIDEIPDLFEGAPDRIEKISIAFARRAKVVDMKQLKQCSFKIFTQKQTANPLQSPCFSEILKDLPKVLNKTMAENMSMPLAFYAILHLCNDKGLYLKSNESLEDFEISVVD